MRIPDRLRFEGTWIVAPQGRGKTTLLTALLKEDLEKDASIIVFGSKGDLIHPLSRSQAVHDRLVLIEPNASLALNPLDVGVSAGHTIALLEYIFSGLLDAQTSSSMSTLLRMVVIACDKIPNATINTMREIIRDGWKPYEQYIRQLDRDDQDYFFNEFEKVGKETKQAIIGRLRDLTSRVPLLREMFRAPKTKINLGSLMDEGKVIIIDNSSDVLTYEGTEFFSRYFIALILAAAYQRARRADKDKKPVYVYIDEAASVIAKDANVARIVQECRSQKIAMTFAHQTLSQIINTQTTAALLDCAVKFANPDADRKALAPYLRTTEEELGGLKRGEFMIYMRDELTKGIAFQVPNNPISMEAYWPKVSEAQMQSLRDRMRRDYGYTPDTPPEARPPPDEPGPATTWGQRPKPTKK